jgi:hypothetical protein
MMMFISWVSHVTSTVTLLCPEGIVMATDSRETTRDRFTGDMMRTRDDVRKIYRVKKQTNIGISCWGLAEIRFQNGTRKDILPYLKEFDNTLVAVGDTVDIIAGKLKGHMENIRPPVEDRMGLHVAGFVCSEDHRIPCLRHVFHSDWHEPGIFSNEDCHKEYHLPNGDSIIFQTRKDYPPLFNGDNLIANALFNYAPKIRPYYDIVPDLLSLQDCIDLAKLIVSTSIDRLNYFFDITQFKKVPQIVGGRVKMAKITENQGFEWVS